MGSEPIRRHPTHKNRAKSGAIGRWVAYAHAQSRKGSLKGFNSKMQILFCLRSRIGSHSESHSDSALGQSIKPTP